VTSRAPEPDPADMTRDELRAFLRSTGVVTLWPFTGAALHLSRPTTYRCAGSGQIRVLALGRAYRVPAQWLETQLFSSDDHRGAS
jgi:hypothetical protein